MWIFIQGSSIYYLLGPCSLRPPSSTSPRASSIAYSYASNTSWFGPRYVFRIFHLLSCHAMLAPMHPESSLDLSFKSDRSPGPLVCLPVSPAPSSLSLTNETMLSVMISDSTHMVYFMPVVVLMLLPPAIAYASRCLSVSLPLPMGLNQSSSPATSSPFFVFFFTYHSVTGRMFLVSCDLGATSNLYSYLHFLKMSRDSAGRSPASRMTVIVRADPNIHVIAHLCVLTSF